MGAIGREDEEDGFLEIVIDGAPFLDGVGDGSEVVVGQHHGGGFLGGFGAFDAHGDADVGAFEGGGVVDAVAGHGHNVSGGLEGGDEAEFVFRGGAGKDVDVLRRSGEVGVGDFFEFVSAEGCVAITDAEGLADGAGGDDVVAGDHFDADAGVLAFGDGGDGFVAGRVDDAGEAEEGEAGLDVCWGQGFLIGRGGADGDGEQALSEPRGFVQTRVPGALVEGFVAVASALGRAGGEDGFGGAFHDDERLVVVRMEGGHEFVCGVERDGGGAGVSVVQLFGVESGFQAEGDEGTFGWFPFKEPAPVFFPEG